MSLQTIEKRSKELKDVPTEELKMMKIHAKVNVEVGSLPFNKYFVLYITILIMFLFSTTGVLILGPIIAVIGLLATAIIGSCLCTVSIKRRGRHKLELLLIEEELKERKEVLHVPSRGSNQD